MSDTGDTAPFVAPPKAPPKASKKKSSRKKATVNPADILRGTGVALEIQEAQRASAERAALGYIAKQQAAAKARKAETESKRQWYVKCRYCHGPAIWLVGNVKGWLNSDNWHASYKAVGVMWPSVDMYCQCCLASGKGKRMVSMHKNAKYTECTPRRRLIQSMPMEEYEDLMAPVPVEAN